MNSLPILTAIAFAATLFQVRAASAVTDAVDELQRVHGRITGAVAEARPRSDHPLWQRHLDSIVSLIETDIARVRLGYDHHEKPEDSKAFIEDSLEFHRRILEGLEGDAGHPEFAMEKGRFSLVLSFVSRRDRSIQYYSVALPKAWDEAKAYPLVTRLHGVGTHHPLGSVVRHFPAQAAGREAGDGTADPDITFRPWGRGNNGYAGFGEIDVYEALDDLNRRVKTDRRRWYLVGGSMGSVGAWRIAIHRPDLWAAVASLANAGPGVLENSPAIENLRGLPFYFQTGSEDGNRVPLTHKRAKLVEALGNEVVVEILPGVGHSIPREHSQRTIDWIKQFRKDPPDTFEYRMDGEVLFIDRAWLGPWGVQCSQERGADPFTFSFELDRESNTLRLRTERVERVEFDPQFLELGSPMRVIWDGETVYEGAAKPVMLKR